MDVGILIGFLLTFPVFIMAVIAHEVSHGWVALRLGDPTALRAGRLTLNPLRHIDWIGTVFLPAFLLLIRSPFLFGWAKPVPINPAYFQHPRRDLVWVGVAVPLANFILALTAAWLIRSFGEGSPAWAGVLSYFVLINLVLGTFNLLPIPPLDGSRILTGLLPFPLARGMAALEPWGISLLLALMYLGFVDRWIWPLVELFLKILGVS